MSFRIIIILSFLSFFIGSINAENHSVKSLATYVNQEEDSVKLIIKALQSYFSVKIQTATLTRKSCDCDCDIRKEVFESDIEGGRFETYDYCDSIIFEWFAPDGNIDEIFEAVMSILKSSAHNTFDEFVYERTKRGTLTYTVEGDNDLTFMEISQWEDGRIQMKASLITALGRAKLEE